MNESKGSQPPAGWVTAAIEDLFAPLKDGRTLHQGWSPQCEKGASRAADAWGVLKTTAIQPGVFLPEHNKVLPAHLIPRPLIEVRVGDILVTCAGPRVRCGVACLVRNTRSHLMVSGKMYRFRVPERHIDARFVEAYLQTATAWDAIDRMKTGGSDSGLNLTHGRFRLLEVPVAPLNEQRRIVEIYEELVSDLEAAVAALERVRAKLKLYRTSLLKAAVEGALTAEWRAQHPHTESASELLQRILAERRRRSEENQLAKFKAKGTQPPKNWKAKYKEPTAAYTANLPPLPEGWSWASLDALLVEGPQNGLYLPNALYGSGSEILRIDDFQNGWVRPRGELKRVEADAEATATYALSERDLIINRVNSMTHLGKCLLATAELKGILFESNMMRTQLASACEAKYVELYLRSEPGRRRLTKDAKWAVNQASINQQDVKRTLLPLPTLAEQEAIVEAVEDQLSVIDHLEADIDAKLKSAQALRQSILRHAFTGKLVPQDPNDEPASELLKRIAAERAARAAAPAARKQRRARKSGKTRVEQSTSLVDDMLGSATLRSVKPEADPLQDALHARHIVRRR